jgi:tetratricopeptide (TPR) repeat protein
MVHTRQESFFQGYVVEIVDHTPQHQTWRADLSIDGSFMLRAVPRGDYLLRVLDEHGDAVKEEFVNIRDQQGSLDVDLPNLQRATPGGPVSVRQLQHPPAQKAIAAAQEAARLGRAGKTGLAVEQLRKAIRISPEYGAAHSNLAAAYIRERNFSEARAEIEQALAITGPNALDLCNLAYLEAMEGRYGEAAESARAALRADPGWANAHYVLGTLLLRDRSTAEEGIRHLERAAETVPGARETLAQLRTRQVR